MWFLTSRVLGQLSRGLSGIQKPFVHDVELAETD